MANELPEIYNRVLRCVKILNKDSIVHPENKISNNRMIRHLLVQDGDVRCINNFGVDSYSAGGLLCDGCGKSIISEGYYIVKDPDNKKTVANLCDNCYSARYWDCDLETLKSRLPNVESKCNEIERGYSKTSLTRAYKRLATEMSI